MSLSPDYKISLQIDDATLKKQIEQLKKAYGSARVPTASSASTAVKGASEDLSKKIGKVQRDIQRTQFKLERDAAMRDFKLMDNMFKKGFKESNGNMSKIFSGFKSVFSGDFKKGLSNIAGGFKGGLKSAIPSISSGLKFPLMLGGILSVVGFLAKLVKSSPMLQAMLELIDAAVTLILMPIGTFIGVLLKPFVLMFLRYVALPFYRTLMPMVASFGKDWDKFISELFVDMADAFKALIEFFKDPLKALYGLFVTFDWHRWFDDPAPKITVDNTGDFPKPTPPEVNITNKITVKGNNVSTSTTSSGGKVTTNNGGRGGKTEEERYQDFLDGISIGSTPKPKPKPTSPTTLPTNPLFSQTGQMADLTAMATAFKTSTGMDTSNINQLYEQFKKSIQPVSPSQTTTTSPTGSTDVNNTLLGGAIAGGTAASIYALWKFVSSGGLRMLSLGGAVATGSFTSGLTSQIMTMAQWWEDTFGSGTNLSGGVAQMANGGVINEEILGVGLSSGRQYRMGESGKEFVVPERRMGNGSISLGGVTIIVQNARNADDIIRQLEPKLEKMIDDMQRRKGVRFGNL